MKITPEGWAVIEGDNYLSAEIIAKGRLDVQRDFLEMFREHIPAGGTVIDVGASLGDTAMTLSEFVGPDGTVFAFEPNDETCECLLHNVGLFKHHNVDVHKSGLGKNHGWVGIDIDRNNIGASRLVLSGTSILIQSLDGIFGAWLNDSSRALHFIKIDAEGWEPLILDGGTQLIHRFRPVMLIEINTWPLGKMNFTPEDVFTRLDKLGYVFPRFDGPYGDILCIPKERA